MSQTAAGSYRYVRCVVHGLRVLTVKSARLIASGKQGLRSLLLWHIISESVVAVGNIEQIKESPSRFITSGQQMVASPIVAASSGTGTM